MDNTNTIEPTSILVPKIIHESIVDIMEAQVRKLAIRIAKDLNVNEKLLIQELKREKLEILTFEDNFDITDLQCKAYTLVKNVYVPCDEPVVYKKQFCLCHLDTHLTFDKLNNLNVLTILNYDTIKYYRNKDNVVYDSEFNKIGIYNEDTQEILHFIQDNS
jgi:predicted house-cleaning noncanonical NTP pyrophosphatase (MazG superfamily)